ncbi:plasma membrane calcium [Coemansia biformis]|uniref:Calcium-transporting ATPase 2 n=1 Tax=Coemansia biformis TaxID=1286918 RepID=A0A9W7YJN1_9FUNG|nr:plasma membrane calcium [Coemansia biformis]
MAGAADASMKAGATSLSPAAAGPSDAEKGGSNSSASERNDAASIDMASDETDALAAMVADKDTDALRKLGGTDELLRRLGVSSDMGLMPSSQPAAAEGAADAAAAAAAPKDTAELAKALAAGQGDSTLSWLAEFDADCELYGERMDTYGVNILPPAKARSFLGFVWDALHDKMLILLIAAAIVSLAIGIYQDVRVTDDPAEDGQNVHWVEGFAIIVAIAVVTLVASVNDYQKEKQFRRLNAKKNDRRVRVTRAGQERMVSTNCILVGDIMHIEPGDILCADGVVVSSSNLKCDESTVTGESDPMKKCRLEDAEKLQADSKSRRKRRRAELRSKRIEQRALAARSSYGKADEIQALGPQDGSGADADDSTDGEGDAGGNGADRALVADFVGAGVHEKAADPSLVPELPPMLAPATAEKRAKSGTARRIDPFLVSGSRVLEGVGRCVLVAVGQSSFHGRTMMSLRTKTEPTPLQLKLNGLAELIAKLGGAAGLLMLITLVIKYAVQLGRHEASRDATSVVDSIVRIIISAVTVVVVAVPEGLPLAVTLALAFATTRMVKDKCFVRVLASCETMGNASTICSDKTGTLTQNRMTVVAGCLGDQYQFSSYPPGTSEAQRRKAKQPPADGLVTDMTGRAVPPEMAVVPTLLETEGRRLRRLRARRQRQQRRRMARAGASGNSSSSGLSPAADLSPSFSGLSDLSDYSNDDDDDLVVPAADLADEAPQAIISLCHDAIAVNSTAFIPAQDSAAASDADSGDELLGGGAGGKKMPLWRRLLRRRGRKAAGASDLAHEEALGGVQAAGSMADKFSGSKTETALLAWSESLGAPNYAQLREGAIDRCVQIWPFSSERKAMSTLVKIRRREDGRAVWRLYVKGAPEVVIQSCRWIVDVDGTFQSQDHDEVLNERHLASSSAQSLADADDEGELGTPQSNRVGIPQINLDHGSDNDSEDDTPISHGLSRTPYLLSAHDARSHNLGSDTTDVGDEALAPLGFPHDFAHNPAIPVLPLDEATLHDLRHTVSDYASRALRTIGMAYRDFDSLDEAELAQRESDVEWRDAAGLVCLGIFAIEDPLRDGVTDAVRSCQNAGIVVRMVTGDNALTARAIATQCGIFTPGMGGMILEGPKFRKLSPAQMDFIIPRLQVLARSSPEDKRMLVEWLRTHGEVVAVTGDGTNDGPALKAANVGFSMGIAGTEVAKEASSIVLMDDNFKSIVRACMWGRSVNDAVKKFLQFQITVNITAVLIAFVSAIADSEEKSVFTAIQLLWINLIMDTFAALALATDPPTTDLLSRYPEKQGSPLITFTMWKHIIGQSVMQVVVCFLTLYAADDIFKLHTVENSKDMVVLRTLVFNTFAWMQIFNEFNCRVLRNELNCFKGIQRNPFFLAIVLISVLGQVIIIQWGGAAFQTAALGAKYWGFSLAAGFLSLPVGLVLRLVPDQLIWWMIPFVSQDIYKKPQSLAWQPPAQNLRSKLAGDSGPDGSPGTRDHYSPGGTPSSKVYYGVDDTATPGGGFKSSVARLGANLSRRVGRSQSPNTLASADGKGEWEQQQRQYDDRAHAPDDTLAVTMQGAVGCEPVAAEAAEASGARRKARRKRSATNDSQARDVATGAMLPLMVATSVGIGMSTSAMPPSKMTIEDLVDQEIEKRDTP